jgi:hypothetical protein
MLVIIPLAALGGLLPFNFVPLITNLSDCVSKYFGFFYVEFIRPQPIASRTTRRDVPTIMKTGVIDAVQADATEVFKADITVGTAPRKKTFIKLFRVDQSVVSPVNPFISENSFQGDEPVGNAALAISYPSGVALITTDCPR